MNALPDSGVGSALRRLRTLGSLETLFREAAQALPLRSHPVAQNYRRVCVVNEMWL